MPLPTWLPPLAIGAGAGLLGLGLVREWQRRDRRFQSTATVAEAYDRWTGDRLLENLWGEHVHLGHYGTPGITRFPGRQGAVRA